MGQHLGQSAESTKGTLKRWLDLTALTVVALLLCALFRPVILNAVSWCGAVMAERRYLLQISALLFLSATVWGVVIRLGGFRLAHLANRNLLRYPPAWLAGILGSCGYLFWHTIRDPAFAGSADSRFSSAFFVAILVASLGGLVLAVFLDYLSSCAPRRIDSETVPSSLDDLSRDVALLRQWIHKEAPIEHPELDLLEHKAIARRIATMLSDGRARTIGLVGPYGSGKSSLLNMVDHYVTNPHALDGRKPTRPKDRWHVCRVEAWGREPNRLAAQLLCCVVNTLSQRVDVLSLVTMPSHYAAAMSATGRMWPAVLSALVTTNKDPVECLCRLDRMLAAMRSRLLIVVEDLDRNTAKRALSDEVPALLDQLRQLQHVSFVLAIGTERRASQMLSRICQHMESLDAVNRSSVKAILEAFRADCLTRYQADLDPIPSEKREQRLGHKGDNELLAHFFEGRAPEPYAALAYFLHNPRLLKQVLRRVDNAWHVLHGEIDFDDLLVVHTLRYAARDVYAFILNHIVTLRNLPEGHRDHPNHDRMGPLESQWNKAIAASDMDEANALLTFLFPWWKTQNRSAADEIPQGIRHTRPTDYWSRIQSEQFDEGEIHDQTILSAISAWRANHAALVDGHRSFARLLVDMPQAGDKIEHFRAMMAPDEIRILAAQLFEIVLTQHGNRAHWETCLACKNLWRMSLRSLWAGHEAWTEEQVCKALPLSIRFANDVYYFWKNRNEDDLHTKPDLPAVRAAVVRAAKKLWDADVQALIRSIDTSCIECLHGFYVFFGEPIPEQQTQEGWHWFGALLLKAAQEAPAIVLPQMTPFLVQKPDQLLLQLELRTETLLSILGDSFREMMNLIATHLAVPNGLLPHEARQVEFLREAAAEWLRTGAAHECVQRSALQSQGGPLSWMEDE